MARPYDAVFDFDQDADLPFDRDFTAWLAGATITGTPTVIIADTTLLDQHDVTKTNGDRTVRVWLLGKGIVGRTLVTVRIVASDGRKDDRTWLIVVRQR